MKARIPTFTFFTVFFALLAFSLIGPSLGLAAGRENAKDYLNAPKQDIENWREMKFGLFIHWGPVSLKGTEIGWSRGGERRGRSGRGLIPAEEYDNLYKRFNPVKFNADEWIRIAKDAGMKYLVFTSKHHDGFANWPSKFTDFSVTPRRILNVRL